VLAGSNIPSENRGLHTIEALYEGGNLELFVEVLTDVDSAVWRAIAPLQAVTG
jgi:hypothetical protein